MLKLSLLLAALMSATLSASALVVFRTPERVVIATDSMRQDDVGHRDFVCKIQPAGRWWFSALGYSGGQGADFPALVRSALAGMRTIAEVRRALTSHVAPKVLADLEANRTKPGFSDLFEMGAPVSAIYVAGTVDGVPTVAVLTLVLKDGPKLSLDMSWSECPGMCPGGVLTGAASVADGPIQRLAHEATTRDAATARRIIAAQIKAAPKDVGGPIDVLEITAAGARWVDRDVRSICKESTIGISSTNR